MRSAHISEGLGIASVLLLCAVSCVLTFLLAPNAVVGSASGWEFLVGCYGLPMSLEFTATLVGIMAATRANSEPRTAAGTEQRKAAAIGAIWGFVSFVVSMALLLVSLLVWLASIHMPSG